MDITVNNEEKIENDQPSYNFIDRFPDIYEQIFGYLDHKSLLNALLVCTSWNEFIGQSSQLMKKTLVNVKKFPDILGHYRISKAWKRKIIHLKVGYVYSLDDRSIERMNINASNLQHLTSLDIEAVDLSSIKELLTTCLLLKNWKVIYQESSPEDWNELAVGFEKIKLKTLSIKLENSRRESDFISSNRNKRFLETQIAITEFLRTQMHLEELQLSGMYLISATMKTIIQMKQLKELKLVNVSGKHDRNMVGNMPSLESFRVVDIETFDPIINSAPNLIKLDLTKLNQAWIYSAGLKLKKLKKLHAFTLDFKDISHPDLFPALELLIIDRFIELDQQKRILQAIAVESTNFKRCLFEEINRTPHKRDR